MQLGRVFGILVLAIGGFFSWLAFSMLGEAGFTMRLFTAGPALAAWGIGLLIFPGGDITAKESREKTKNPQVVFKEAPMSNKIAWVVFAITGFFISRFIY